MKEYLSIKKPSQDGTMYSLNDFHGKKIVLYFYPKDNTPGCTLEAIDFTKYKADFERLNTVIIGVSKDSVSSHASFCKKQNLSLILLSDEELDLIKQFDVWQLKKNYGKEYMGLVRSTFILNETGDIIKEYRNVKVNGHVEQVLSDISNL